MKKRIILSSVALLSLGFLFTHDLTVTNDDIKAANIEALANAHNTNNGNWFNYQTKECDLGGIITCLEGADHDNPDDGR